MEAMKYIERRIEKALHQAMADYPVVTVVGPRQAGKTTLVQHTYPQYRYVNLELPDYRQLAIEDPHSFLKRFETPVIIDEIQRVPELLSYIQVHVDEHRSLRGGYILTGRQHLEMRAAVSQSLAGRTAILKLLPLSIAELEETGIVLDRDDLKIGRAHV